MRKTTAYLRGDNTKLVYGRKAIRGGSGVEVAMDKEDGALLTLVRSS